MGQLEMQARVQEISAGDKARPDLKGVYDEFLNNRSAAENAEERQAANQAFKQAGILPDFEIIGIDQQTQSLIFANSKTNTLIAINKDSADQRTNIRPEVDTRAEVDQYAAGLDKQNLYASKFPGLFEILKGPNSQGNSDEITFVRLPDGTYIVKGADGWYRATEKGEILPVYRKLDISSVKQVDGKLVITHADANGNTTYSEEIAQDGTIIKKDAQGKVFEVVPKGDWSKMTHVNRDKDGNVDFVQLPNGTRLKKVDGKWVTVDKDGNKTGDTDIKDVKAEFNEKGEGKVTITHADNSTEEHYPDGRIIKKDASGKVVSDTNAQQDELKAKAKALEVQKGEGYYQTAARILRDVYGIKNATHKQILELARFMRDKLHGGNVILRRGQKLVTDDNFAQIDAKVKEMQGQK